MSIQIQKISDLNPLDLSTNTCSAYVIVSSKYGSTEEPPTNKNYKVDIQTSYNTIRQNINNLCSYTYTHIGELCGTVNTNSSDIADLKTCTTTLRTSHNTLCSYTYTHIGELYSCVSDLRSSYNNLNTYTTSNIGTLYDCTNVLLEYINTIDNKYHNICNYTYTHIGELCSTVNTIISCNTALRNSYNTLSTYTTTHVARLYRCTSALRTSHNNLCSYTYTRIGELKTGVSTIGTNVIILTSKHNDLCSYAHTYIGDLNTNTVKTLDLFANKNPDSTTYITGIKIINSTGGTLVKNTYIDNYLYYNTSYHTLSIGCNYAVIHNAHSYTKHNLVVGDGNGIYTNNDNERVSYSFISGNNNIAKRTQSSVIHGIDNIGCDIIASFMTGYDNASCHNWTIFIAGHQNNIDNSSYSVSIGTNHTTRKGNYFTAIGDWNNAYYGYYSTAIGRYNSVLCSKNIIEIGIGAYAYQIKHPSSTTLLGNYGYLDNTNDNVEHKNILVIGDGYLQNTDPYRHNAIQLYENSQHQSYLEIYSPLLLDASTVDPQGKFIGKLRIGHIIDANNVIDSAYADKLDPTNANFDKSLYISYAIFNRYTCNDTMYICANTINVNNALYGIATVIDKIN